MMYSIRGIRQLKKIGYVLLSVAHSMFRALIYISAFGMMLAKMVRATHVAGMLLVVCAIVTGGYVGIDYLLRSAEGKQRAGGGTVKCRFAIK